MGVIDIMSNNLERLKSELRRLAKRCKDVKYTEGLLLAFLITGLLAFSETGVTSAEIKETRQSIDTSISDMKKLFKEAKQENNKLLKQSNLELIQLMEQGDHVVKSPWSSWQFGMNYFYSDWQGMYKGRGDKAEKYPYEGVYTRYAAGTESEMYRYVTSALSKMAQYVPQSSDPTAAASSSRQSISSSYGIASTTVVPKAPVNIELNASISPRDVGKKSPSSLPSAPVLVLPAYEPKLITPPVAPAIPQL